MKFIAANCSVLVALAFAVQAAGVTPAFGQTAATAKNTSGGTMERKYSDEENANLRAVRKGFDDWSNGTGSPYQLLDDNVSWTIVGDSLASKEYPSRKAFIDEVITPFNQRMSKGLVPKIRDIYADGDTVIVFFDAEGTAKDNKQYANTYSWFLRFRGGKIVRATAFFDSIRFNDLWTRVAAAKAETGGLE